jgi:hypothetical protein
MQKDGRRSTTISASSTSGCQSHSDYAKPSEEADNRWRAVEEMDRVLDRLEGRLGRITAMIQSTCEPERLLDPGAATEMDLDKSMEDSPENFCSPVLRNSLERHRIVDMGSGEVETVHQPRDPRGEAGSVEGRDIW